MPRPDVQWRDPNLTNPGTRVARLGRQCVPFRSWLEWPGWEGQVAQDIPSPTASEVEMGHPRKTGGVKSCCSWTVLIPSNRSIQGPLERW